jgi:hypothetical protein
MDIATGAQKARRFVAGLSVATMLATFFAGTIAQAASFQDVPADAWFYTYVEQLAAKSIVDTSQQNFRPADNANRAEAAKMLVQAAGLTLDSSAGPSFSDVASSAWYYQYVETAAKTGIVGGYKDAAGNLTGKFGPGDSVTREQFAKMAMSAFNLTSDTTGGPHFSDVPTTAWSYADVETLYNNSVVDGYPDGTFHPGANINRAEIAKMVVGVMNPIKRSSSGVFTVESAMASSATMAQVCFSAAPDAVASLVTSNYSITDATSAPLAVAAVAADTTDTNCVDLTTATQTVNATYTVTVGAVTSKTAQALTGKTTTFPGFGTVVSGSITAALSTDNPASATIVSGQATADLAHFTFTGTGTLQGITLQRTGVSSSSTVSNVYLYNGAARVSDGASVNTAGVINFNNLNLPVSGSLELSVKADIATGMSGQTLGVTMSGFTISGATQANPANLAGNLMSITSGSGILAGVVVDNGGGVALAPATNSFNLTPDATVNAGTLAYTVWSAPIQVNTRSVYLKSLALRYIGSAPSDALSNITLYINGVASGTATVNAQSYVVFDMTAAPVTLQTGSTTLEVRGDIQKGTDRNFNFSLQNAADLMVTDSQLGVNVAPTTGSGGTNATFSISQAGTISISTGSVTMQVDPTFLTETNVTGGSANTAIGKFTIHAYGEDVKVNQMLVTPILLGAVAGAGGSGVGLNNVSLYFDGGQVGSSQNWDGVHALSAFQLGSSMVVPAGQDSTFEVRADLQDTTSIAYTGGTVGVTVNAGGNNAQGQSSLNTTSVPATPVSTSGLSISGSQLAIGANTGYASQTYSPNTPNVTLGSFILQNQSSSEGVRITGLTVGLITGKSTYSTTTTTTGATALTGAATAITFASTAGMGVGDTLTFAGGPTTGTVVSVTDLTHAVINFGVVTGTATGAVSGTQAGTMALSNIANVKTDETSGSGATAQPAANPLNYSVDFTLAPGASKTLNVIGDLSGAIGGSVYTTLKVTGLGTISNQAITQPLTPPQGQLIVVGVSALTAPALLSGSSTQAQYIAAGTSTASTNCSTANYTGTAYFQVAAANGTGTIQEMKFKADVSQLGEVPDSIACVRINGTNTASILNGYADVTGLSIPVPSGASGTTVKADVAYAPVGINGSDVASGTPAAIGLTYVKALVGGSVSQIGTSTSTTILANTTSPLLTIVGSVPALTVSSTQVKGLNLNAENQIGQVTVVANAAGNIGIHQLEFVVSAANFAGPGMALTLPRLTMDGSNDATDFNIGAGAPMSTAQNCAIASGAPGSNYVVNCTLRTDLTTDSQLTAGSSHVFSLYATTSGSAATSALAAISSSVSPANFKWQDIAGSGQPNALNGTLIYSFPTNSYSISQ